jgi:hypothetical protein
MSEDQIGIRIPPELRAEILENVGPGKKYRKITDFVIAAVEEKLHPQDNIDEDLEERIRLALINNPTLLDDSLRRIGIRFYARKSGDQP